MATWSREVFAKNLKFYVERSGKMQKDIAEAVGVSGATFTDWIKAKKYPRIDKIELLAEYFGILKSDLIEDKEKPAEDDGFSANKQALIEFAKTVPEDKAAMILRVLRSIVEGE